MDLEAVDKLMRNFKDCKYRKAMGISSGVRVNTQYKPYKREEVSVISKAKHYNQGKYEVIDVLQDWFSTDPLLWQVGKYIGRCKHKKDELGDLIKARYYLEKKIASVTLEKKNV